MEKNSNRNRKKIKDETVRLLEGMGALLVSFILLAICYGWVVPAFGSQNAKAAVIVLTVLGFVLFLLALALFATYLALYIRRIRRENRQSKDADAAPRASIQKDTHSDGENEPNE